MTDSVDFNELRQMMLILKQLRSEVDRGDWHRRDLCIKMHDDVCKKLYPFFEELAELDLLVLFTKPEGDKLADVSNLEVDGINGGIQLTKKEQDDVPEDTDSEEGIVLTEVDRDPNDPDPEVRHFTFEF